MLKQPKRPDGDGDGGTKKKKQTKKKRHEAAAEAAAIAAVKPVLDPLCVSFFQCAHRPVFQCAHCSLLHATCDCGDGAGGIGEGNKAES